MLRRSYLAVILIGLCGFRCMAQQPTTRAEPKLWRPMAKADPLPMLESLDKETQINIEMRIICVPVGYKDPLLGEEFKEAGPHYQILDDARLTPVIRATQSDKRSTTVTAPRITVFNGQSTIARIGSQRGFIGKIPETEEERHQRTFAYMRVGVWNSGNDDIVHINMGPLWLKPLKMMERWPETADAQENVLWRSEAWCVLRQPLGLQVQSGQVLCISGINMLAVPGADAVDDRKVLLMMRCKMTTRREEEYKTFGHNFDRAATPPTTQPR